MTVFSRQFANGIKIHGFKTGTVAVKQEHYRYSGLGPLRMPRILFGHKWVEAMPIWAWAIETPSGNYLVDTGESTDFYRPDHFSDPLENYVNRKILQIDIDTEQEIHRQLRQVGLTPDKIDAVLMTHMHLDHVDGIQYFPNAEFIISKTDWEQPIGVPLSVFPEWFVGKQIQHAPTSLPFAGAFKIDDNIQLISTPGHTFGHQSILVDGGDAQVLLAGDTTFNEDQLIRNEFGGIHLSIEDSWTTLKKIRHFSQDANLIYLPSHDPESGRRLQEGRQTRSE